MNIKLWIPIANGSYSLVHSEVSFDSEKGYKSIGGSSHNKHCKTPVQTSKNSHNSQSSHLSWSFTFKI